MQGTAAEPNHDIGFIGIGAQKCASTWLWRNLNRHPGVWMPHVKELHYFDRSLDYPSPSILAEKNVWKRLTSSSAHNRKWRRIAVRNAGASILKRDIGRVRWDISYFLGRYDDEWYKGLFNPGPGQICGEITPSYALLTIADIRRLRALAPNARVIYILRDPIDRAWSQLRFDNAAGRIGDLSDMEELQRYVNSATVRARGEYLATLEKWSSEFSMENIFVGYYDEIQSDPAAFLGKVASFLDIDSDGFDVPQIRKKVKISNIRTMPEDVERMLAQQHLPTLESLASKFDGPPVQWLERARTVAPA